MSIKISILVLILFAASVFCGRPAPMRTSIQNGRMTCQGNILPGRLLRTHGYYVVTSQGVFYRCSRIANANPYTFDLLDAIHSYDDRNIYYGTEILRGVNYDFAEVIRCSSIPNLPNPRRSTTRSCLQDNVNYFVNGRIWFEGQPAW